MEEINKRNKIIKYLKYLMLVIVSFVGLGSIIIPTQKAEAFTIKAIKDGKRSWSSGQSGSKDFDYLLSGNTSKGKLPDIKNLSQYGVSNQGWGLQNAGNSPGGVSLQHVVFPSESGFREHNGETYLRISGRAVIPKYFHHTKNNHRVAILTKEEGGYDTVKLWEATLVNLTSSASNTYGYGQLKNGNDSIWINTARMNIPGVGDSRLQATTTPFPSTANKADGKGSNAYFDNYYSNMFNFTSLNKDQVSKLAGLGYYGSNTMDGGNVGNRSKEGSAYIYDYSGFVVDIPAKALINDMTKSKKLELSIVMTMTTPNGKQERIVGSNLHVPSIRGSTAELIDTETGTKGKVTFEVSDTEDLDYSINESAMRRYKMTSNFTTTAPSKYKYSFSASTNNPIMASVSGGYFTDDQKKQVNSNKGVKESREHYEDKLRGRGDLLISWVFPGSSARVHTGSYLAYQTMPKPNMRYTFTRQEKPLIINHRLLLDDRNPGDIFKREITTRAKGGSGKTFKPLTQSELNSLGTNMEYLNKGKINATDPKSPIESIGTGGRYLSNADLFSSKYNGNQSLMVDYYYSGTPKTQSPGKEDWTYTVKHVDKATDKEISNTRTTGTIKPGHAETVYRVRPYGYEYSGELRVDGSKKTGTSYVIRHNSDSKKSINVTFYYNRRSMNYNVEHRNKATGNKIHEGTSGKLYFDKPKTFTASRLTSSTGLPSGYTSRNEYTVNGGSAKSGTSYTFEYDDEAGTQKVVFWYDWNEPEDSTKRIPGDDGTGIRALDLYLNTGINTKRDTDGEVTGESLDANASAVLDSYKAPIAVLPVKNTISFKHTGGTYTTSSSTNNTNILYNDKYLESIEVASRMGGSKDVDNRKGSKVNVTNLTNSYRMSNGSITSMDELERKARGTSGASSSQVERHYLGRWIGLGNDIKIEQWTPSNGNDYLRHASQFKDGVNQVDSVETSQEYDIYNILKHNYEPDVGSDGVEYYEYKGSTITSGYHEYDSRGNYVRERSGKGISQTTSIDTRDYKLGEYVDAEGFKVRDSETAPVQFKVASETFDDGGVQYNGYESNGHGHKDANYPIIKESELQSGAIGREERVDVDYYEEFGYKTNHVGNDLLTQQAITVGGEVDYVNPYDYFNFPTAGTRSVQESSGRTEDSIKDNITKARSTGEHVSELEFNKKTSGFYAKEVDTHETFENSHDAVNDTDVNTMKDRLKSANQYSPSKAKTGSSKGLTYSRVDQVHGHDSYNFRLPITTEEDSNDLRLDAKVYVGKDSGYPVVAKLDDTEEQVTDKFKESYESDLGSEPTDTDEVITVEDGNTYLVPLKRDKHKLTDKYDVRLYADKVGISQFGVLDENRLTTENYLYGRGKNTLYSGQREEVKVEGENLTVKGNTVVRRKGEDDKATDSKTVDGVRTSNIVDIIKNLIK